jgi:hypothetical protein
MCRCTPNIRTPFCGKPGCEWPPQAIDPDTKIAMVLADSGPVPVRGRSFFASKFEFGDRVSIDKGDQAGTVTGFCFYPHGLQVQVSWWNNGALNESWLAEWRLAPVEA